MNAEPIIIRASKPFAMVFIPIALVSSVWGFVAVLSSTDDLWIRIVEAVAAIFFASVSLFGVYTLVSKRFIYDATKARDNVSPKILITEDGVTCEYTQTNKTESIRWDEVDMIQVLTTDEGPAVCDVFFVLQNTAKQTGVVLPQDRPETNQVFEKVQRWPGFDNENLIKAMGSAENKWFVVWKKE